MTPETKAILESIVEIASRLYDENEEFTHSDLCADIEGWAEDAKKELERSAINDTPEI